jgi:hypothetical protein
MLPLEAVVFRVKFKGVHGFAVVQVRCFEFKWHKNWQENASKPMARTGPKKAALKFDPGGVSPRSTSI